VIRKYPTQLIFDAIRYRDKQLGDLGVRLAAMVWAECRMDEALENATSDQRAQFYHQIDPH